MAYDLPYPDRFLLNLGAVYALSAFCGSVFFFSKGARNSPNGLRLMGGLQSLRSNVPPHAAGASMFAMAFGAVEYASIYIRQTDDSWTDIISGGGAGFIRGMFHMRGSSMGLITAPVSGLIGVGVFSLGEAVHIMEELQKNKKHLLSMKEEE